MATRDIARNAASWPNAAVVGTGHYAEYYDADASPYANTLVVRGPDGKVLATRPEGIVGVHDAAIDTAGRLFVMYVPFANQAIWRIWDTGIVVAPAVTPPPTPSGTQLDRIEAGVVAIRARVGA